MQLSPPKLIAPEQQFAACLTNGGGFVPLEPFISDLFIMHSKVYRHVSLFNMLSAEHVYLINLCHGVYEA